MKRKHVLMGWYCDVCKCHGFATIFANETFTKFQSYVNYQHSQYSLHCDHPQIKICRPVLFPEDTVPWDKHQWVKCASCKCWFANENWLSYHLEKGCKR